MSDNEVHQIKFRTNDGKLVPVQVRVKGRCDQDGVEGVLFALLHPNNTDFEVMEVWAPIAANPDLSALTKE